MSDQDTREVNETSQTQEPPAPEKPAEEPTPGVDAAPEPEPKPEAKSTPKPKKAAKPKSVKKPTPSEKLAAAAERNREMERKAKEKAKAQGKEKTERTLDPDTIIAHKATALATHGSVSKDGTLEVGPRKFGAACNTTQVKAVREQVKGKNILQVLGNAKESHLKSYAEGNIKATELPEEVKAALKAMNAKFPPKMKMWPRKDAAILFVLHQERKANTRKSASKKADKKEPVAA